LPRTLEKAIRTPIYFIVHPLQEGYNGLAHARYFFMDVTEDGIELHKPKPKTPTSVLAIAQEYC